MSMMQQLPTKRSSNTSMLIGAVGVGAMAAYALSSPRRRSGLLAAGQSALGAGSRLATASADRLRDVLPDRALDAVSALRTSARTASGRASSAGADTLHELGDRASEAMQNMLSRARSLSADTTQAAQRRLQRAERSVAKALDDRPIARSTVRGGVVLAAVAIIGSALYAMQRNSAGDRVRRS
jgi:hypothetical protein